MKQQAALPPGSPRDEGRPNTARNLFKQFGSAVAGLLVIAYIGLQLALNVGDFVEVENAMQAYVEAQTDVTAYIFREESAIYASAGGVCAYIAEDGEKVSRGQDVAAVLSSQMSSAPQLGQLYARMEPPSSPQSSFKPEVSHSPPSVEGAGLPSADCPAAAALASFSA